MRKKLKLERKIGNVWRLKHEKLLLVEFSVLDQIEAVRFAENWLSSFAYLYVDLEVPSECNIPTDSEEARVPAPSDEDSTP